MAQSTLERPAVRIQNKFRTVLVLLTNRCNLECKHCYVSSSPYGSHGLEKERVLTLVDEIYTELGSVLFVISGGEALVRPRDTFDILEYAARRHRIKLISNGTRITSEFARTLAQLRVYLKISLDGGTASSHDFMRGNGSFEKTMRGIENLLEADYPIHRLGLGATITPDSIGEIAAVMGIAERYGISMIRFGSLLKGGRAAEFWPNFPITESDIDGQAFKTYFSSEFEQHYGTDWELIDFDRAITPFKTLQIYYNGEVYPYTPVTPQDQTGLTVGNILTDSLRDVLRNPDIGVHIMRQFIAFNLGPERSIRNFYAVRRSILAEHSDDFSTSTGIRLWDDD